MSFITIGLLILGLVLLVYGAELLVKGASSIAASLGLSPLVIGLTIVAYGTSAPEMSVSVMSSYAGQADIAVGNVVGSNIFNVLLILGSAALVTPLVVAQQLIRLDVPIMIGVSVLMLVFGWDGKISHVDGIILFLGAITYTVFLIVQGKQERNPEVQAEYEQFGRAEGKAEGKSVKQLLISIGLIGLGIGMLVLGSRWLVDGAVAIARAVGLSELIIGLTIVSAGTSLPELATSIVASIRGERDIAVGNVVGSNIFNILAVMGLSAALSPNGLAVSPAISHFDAPVMIAVAIACLPVFTVGNLIARWEGAMFVGYYIAYVIYLILQATQHDSLPLLSSVMLWFVIPLTVITLVTVYWRAIASGRSKQP